MAIDAQTAQRLIQQYGVQPPAGVAPGTPAYDQWATQWLQSAVNAGDPAAVQAAGGKTTEGGGGVMADWQNAAPSSQWLGQRNPTPAELRKYAREAGWSEDFDRFDDRQLAAWIGKSWKGDHFENDFGDRVEKPTESGPNSKAAGFATGEKSAGQGGGGGGGGGNAGAASAYQALDDPLQAALYQLAQSRGIQGQGDVTNARSLAGGGVLTWSQPDAAAAKKAAAPQSAMPTIGGSGVTPPAAGAAATGPVSNTPQPAMIAQAFTPQGFSAPNTPAQSGAASSGGITQSPGQVRSPGQPAAGGAAQSPWATWSGGGSASPTRPAWTGVGDVQTQPGSLDSGLTKKFMGRGPLQQWWAK